MKGLDGAALARSRLRALSSEGFVNAWSAQLSVTGKAADRVSEEGSLGDLETGAGARAACAPDGYVVPRKLASNEAAPASGPSAVLSGVLVSDRAQRLEVRASAAGKVTLFIGKEKLVVEELRGREGRPLPDERFFDVDVPAGASPIVARVEPETGGLILRLRDARGDRPQGLAFYERFEQASCKPAQLVQPELALELGDDGLHLVGAPKLHGLVPLFDAAPELSLEITTGKGASTGAKIPLEVAAMSGVAAPSKPPASPLVALPAKGGADVRVALGDQTMLSRALPGPAPLVDRAAKLVHAVASIRADARLPAGSRESFEMAVETIASAIEQGETEQPWLEGLVKEAEQLAAQLAEGRDPYDDKRGVVHRAYRSPLDGRLQPYVAYVPPSLAPRSKPPEKKKGRSKAELPLVVIAHGRDRLPEHALRTLIGEAPDEHMTLKMAARHMPSFGDRGAVLVAPWSFGNAGVQPVGEEDVLAVIDEMKKAYGIDARRVSMTGYSLGGTMSFFVPLHHPARFSSASPLCGYPNLLDYASVSKVKRRPWEDALLEKEYIVRYVENGASVPLYVVHGGKDGPGRSLVVVDRYKALGLSHVWDLLEDNDHNVWDDAYEDGKMIGWLARHTIPSAPKRSRFVTGKLRYAQSYWLTVTRMIDPASRERAEVEATIEEEKLLVATKNVAGLEIDTDAAGLTRDAAFSLVVDGHPLALKATGKILLERGDDGSFSVKARASLLAHKHPGQSGPLDDVFHGPLVIVYGTGDPPLEEANRLVAEHLATLGGSADVRYPILADRDATDAALGGRSVVLIGGPASNALAARIRDLLPAKIEPRAITLRGERFEGDDVATSFIFPAPTSFDEGGSRNLADGRYVVVHAGTSPRATLAARMLPRYLPDYVVYDSSLAVQRGGLLMDTRPVRAAGFFGEAWQ